MGYLANGSEMINIFDDSCTNLISKSTLFSEQSMIGAEESSQQTEFTGEELKQLRNLIQMVSPY